MGIARHRSSRSINIWPGFVDALATLLLVLIFVLLVFVLAQVLLSEVLSGREQTLRRVQDELADLTDVLALERRSREDRERQVARLSSELQASISARAEAESLLQGWQSRATQAEGKLAAREQELAAVTRDITALQALQAELQREAAALGKRAQAAEAGLGEEKKISESARAQITLLNQQLAAVRDQLTGLASALDASEKKAAEQQAQIVNLGQRLNAALAGKVQELARYRSEFFGRMREILGNSPDVRIVGDRFVFPSEVLFPVGSAEIGAAGREQIKRTAGALKEIAARIPSDVDWILQVEGHTDRTPIATVQFPSNWELSQARAMSVIRLLTEEGIPPQRLAAAGYAEFQPIDAGASGGALGRNRRIELKLTQR
jgi:chemotaxis protein MotB